MYYPKEQIILEENSIIDVKTGQKFEMTVHRKKIVCFPTSITKEDIKKAEHENVSIESLSNFTDQELRERRKEITSFLKLLKRERMIIYSFI